MWHWQVAARTGESGVRRRTQAMSRSASKRRSRFSSLWGLDTTSKKKQGRPSINQVSAWEFATQSVSSWLVIMQNVARAKSHTKHLHIQPKTCLLNFSRCVAITFHILFKNQGLITDKCASASWSAIWSSYPSLLMRLHYHCCIFAASAFARDSSPKLRSEAAIQKKDTFGKREKKTMEAFLFP